MSDDDYTPARDPGGDRPGGDRVHFEVDSAGYEQSIFGGSAADIERSIMEDTAVNIEILGQKITMVETLKNNMGTGELLEVKLFLGGTPGKSDGKVLRFAWTERGMVMAVKS